MAILFNADMQRADADKAAIIRFQKMMTDCPQGAGRCALLP